MTLAFLVIAQVQGCHGHCVGKVRPDHIFAHEQRENSQHQVPLAFGQCNGFFHTLLSRQRPDLLHSLYKMLRDILLPLLRYRLRVRGVEAEKGKEKKKQDEMVEMQIVYSHIFQAINLDKFNYFLFFFHRFRISFLF